MVGLFQEVSDLVGTLHNDCVKFIRGNLFKVTRSQGWKSLKITTQKDIKEGKFLCFSLQVYLRCKLYFPFASTSSC